MFDWFKRKKITGKEDSMIDIKTHTLVGTFTVPASTVPASAPISSVNSGMGNYVSNHTSAQVVYSNLTGAAGTSVFPGGIYTSIGAAGGGGAIGGQAQFAFHRATTNILSINGVNNQEIVRITCDGEVIWANGYQIDEAAEILARSLHLGAEISAGIRNSTKQKMRDVVFEEMISMAQEKGSLTADELTYLWQAAKIMDKLKGVV